MNAGVDAVEKSLGKTNLWIKEVAREMDSDEDTAYKALKGTLNVLRDRLSVEEATDFAAQLPMVLKGAYYDGYNPSGKPERLDMVAFVSRIHAALGNNPEIDPESVVAAVMNVLEKHITDGEMDDVYAALPDEITKAWR